MLSAAATMARSAGIDTTALYQKMSAASIASAIREQGLADLVAQLRGAVPDLSDQFTEALDREEYDRYWEIKMRGQHAWQMRCVQDSLKEIGGTDLILADIGDSSGNHGAYIRALAGKDQVARIVSVNLDPVAVEKVRAKGGEAVLCRAEELDLQQIRPQLFLSFETVEHLTDPVRFLHALATEGSAEHLLMTVPFRRKSRFGGAHMRLAKSVLPDAMTAEEVHIYEFSPEDWVLLADFAGFKPVFTSTYLQYPRRGALRAMAPIWRKLDFEGFFGVLLRRDLSLASRYTGW